MIRGRLRSVLVGGVSACLVAVVLAGCGPSPKPEPPRTPDPLPTPLYSSDAKALAAAKDAYARYVQVLNDVAHTGWADLSPLKAVTTGDALKSDTRIGKEYAAQGLTMTGDFLGGVKSIQQIQPTYVIAYTCLNVSDSRFIDGSGADRTTANRSSVIPFEVRFVKGSAGLIVERTDRWSDDSLCS